MKDYDIVYIGYPIWGHSTPKVVDTFLAKYNLKGKTVIPFCTSGGSDISESMDVIKKLCKGSTILEGYTAGSGSTKQPSPVVSPSNPPENTDSGKKKLIVYFSWSSNTERMATYIQEQTGGLAGNGFIE